MTNRAVAAALMLLWVGILGCEGLRYNQTSPEAKIFHPRHVAALPAETRAFPESRGMIDRVLAEVLVERGWFASVTGGDTIARRMETDADLRQAVQEFLAKRDKVNYSDPELSTRIGTLTGADALLLIRVDYWNYTTENDKKVGKVGVSIEMIDPRKGSTLWAASHSRASDYVIIKPDLPDVARQLLRQMADYMPH